MWLMIEEDCDDWWVFDDRQQIWWWRSESVEWIIESQHNTFEFQFVEFWISHHWWMKRIVEEPRIDRQWDWTRRCQINFRIIEIEWQSVVSQLARWVIDFVDEMPLDNTERHIDEWKTTRLAMRVWNHWMKCWKWTPHWQIFTCTVNDKRKETQNEWFDIMCFDLVFRQWDWKWRSKSTWWFTQDSHNLEKTVAFWWDSFHQT